MNFAVKTIPLSRRGEYLKLDRADGRYRCAFYRPNYNPRTKKIEGEERIAGSSPRLLDALVIVLGEADSNQDPRTVEAYIRATPWGRELP